MSDCKPLMVEERLQGKPKGPAQKLTDYVNSLPEKPLPHEWAREEIRNNPIAKKEANAKFFDEQRREIALDQIVSDIKYGKNLNTKDINYLSRDDLENIKKFGDAYLRQLAEQKPTSNSDQNSMVRERSPTDNSFEKPPKKEPEKNILSYTAWFQENRGITIQPVIEIEQPTMPWPEGYVPKRSRDMGMSR